MIMELVIPLQLTYVLISSGSLAASASRENEFLFFFCRVHVETVHQVTSYVANCFETEKANVYKYENRL